MRRSSWPLSAWGWTFLFVLSLSLWGGLHEVFAQSCSKGGECRLSGSHFVCNGGQNSGQDCDRNSDCPGASCVSTPYCSTLYTDPGSCTLNGTSCTSGCPAGYCNLLSCTYVASTVPTNTPAATATTAPPPPGCDESLCTSWSPGSCGGCTVDGRDGRPYTRTCPGGSTCSVYECRDECGGPNVTNTHTPTPTLPVPTNFGGVCNTFGGPVSLNWQYGGSGAGYRIARAHTWGGYDDQKWPLAVIGRGQRRNQLHPVGRSVLEYPRAHHAATRRVPTRRPATAAYQSTNLPVHHSPFHHARQTLRRP